LHIRLTWNYKLIAFWNQNFSRIHKHTKDFKTEFYVENEFNISSVIDMDVRNFSYYKIDESRELGKYYLSDDNGKPIVFSDY